MVSLEVEGHQKKTGDANESIPGRKQTVGNIWFCVIPAY